MLEGSAPKQHDMMLVVANISSLGNAPSLSDNFQYFHEPKPNINLFSVLPTGQ